MVKCHHRNRLKKHVQLTPCSKGVGQQGAHLLLQNLEDVTIQNHLQRISLICLLRHGIALLSIHLGSSQLQWLARRHKVSGTQHAVE